VLAVAHLDEAFAAAELELTADRSPRVRLTACHASVH
jgi:hypothetical protein